MSADFRNPELLQLLSQCLELSDRGMPAAARRLLTKAGQVAQTENLTGRSNIALVRAMIEQEAGEFTSAVVNFTEASNLASERLDSSAGITLYLHSNTMLGALYRTQGKYADADRVLSACAAKSAGTNADPLDRAALYNELGIVCKYSGHFERGAEYYLHARTLMESELDPNDPELASIYHNIGGLEHARGDFVAAEGPARQALAIRAAALGPENVIVAADRAALAPILFGLGKACEAEELLREALDTFEREYGPDHFEAAMATSNLAVIVQERGDLREAEQCYLSALPRLEAILGEEHPELAPVLNNLAILRQLQNAHLEAKLLMTRVQSILEGVVAAEHPLLKNEPLERS
ncbi:tetratricopeptide repeat protein [Streptomyces bobili]|uniref:tetratricopeptide repeat protein n=1 Tax=Streptomyces bobili TaxID=67280 RepID=UPI003821E060